MESARPGDKNPRWRESYTRVKKDFFSDPQETNRSRLRLLGVHTLPRETRILDVGAGDGNLFRTLRDFGFEQVWGLEYQPELVSLHPEPRRVVVGSATEVPFETGSMSAAIVMDVLHHLTQAQLPACFTEIRRVLKPGGVLFVCEPCNTRFRKILTLLLMSPLSGLTPFSRDKRAMVEQERDTLDPWLRSERDLQGRLAAGGFRSELFRRCWLHHYGRFRAM